jgi:hypothetical protein
VCLAGSGVLNASLPALPAPCSTCGYDTYQAGGTTVCTPCPNTTFTTTTGGAGSGFTSPGTTLVQGATSVSACVAQQGQLSPTIGQAYFSSTLLSLLTRFTDLATIGACIASVPPNVCGVVQYDTVLLRCYSATLMYDSWNTTGIKLEHKLPPNNTAGAASGQYSRCALPISDQATWVQMGTPLNPVTAAPYPSGAVTAWDANRTEAECQTKCDASTACFGFMYNADAHACLYRGSLTVANARAFFLMPDFDGLINGTSPPTPFVPRDNATLIFTNGTTYAPSADACMGGVAARAASCSGSPRPTAAAAWC